MNPYFKAVCSVLRLVAAGLLVVGALLAGLEFLNHRAKGVDLNLLKIAVNALVFLAGVVLFALAGKLAAHLTGETDEGEDADELPPPDA